MLVNDIISSFGLARRAIVIHRYMDYTFKRSIEHCTKALFISFMLFYRFRNLPRTRYSAIISYYKNVYGSKCKHYCEASNIKIFNRLACAGKLIFPLSSSNWKGKREKKKYTLTRTDVEFNLSEVTAFARMQKGCAILPHVHIHNVKETSTLDTTVDIGKEGREGRRRSAMRECAEVYIANSIFIYLGTTTSLSRVFARGAAFLLRCLRLYYISKRAAPHTTLSARLMPACDAATQHAPWRKGEVECVYLEASRTLLSLPRRGIALPVTAFSR